jgi:GNAT superfamily N-acetyltransferase
MSAYDDLVLRPATRADLPAIVGMLADDELGSARETVTEPLADAYYQAFAEIDADANNLLIVACLNDQVVGSLQMTFTPSLSYSGGRRVTVESVRTIADQRSQGIGTRLMQYAVDEARQRHCVLMQLTTHASRTAAHRFYKRLGFKAEHIGMKLLLRED